MQTGLKVYPESKCNLPWMKPIVVFFMVDAREGLNASDKAIAETRYVDWPSQ